MTEQANTEIRDTRIARAAGPEFLHAHIRSVRASSRPVLLFVHGFSVDGLESHRMFMNFARTANERGYSTVLFDQFGSGYSDGDYRDYRLGEAKDDVVKMVSEAVAATDNSGKCVLVGQSLGTACIALAESESRPNLAGVVLWNVSANIGERYPKLFGKGIATDPNFILPEKGLEIGSDFIRDADAQPIMDSFDRFETRTMILICGDDEKSDTNVARSAERRIVSAETAVVHVPGANHSFKGQPDLERTAISESIAWIDDSQ